MLMYICLYLNWSWWRHQMETFSALLAFCVGNSLDTSEFPTQRPVTWSFGVFFELRLNQQLSKQWGRRWFETPSCSLWHYCNDSVSVTKGTASTRCNRSSWTCYTISLSNLVTVVSDNVLYIPFDNRLQHEIQDFSQIEYPWRNCGVIIGHIKTRKPFWRNSITWASPVSLTVFPSQFKFDGNFVSLSPRY